MYKLLFDFGNIKNEPAPGDLPRELEDSKIHEEFFHYNLRVTSGLSDFVVKKESRTLTSLRRMCHENSRTQIFAKDSCCIYSKKTKSFNSTFVLRERQKSG